MTEIGTLSHYIKWSYFLNWLKKGAILLGDYAKWEDKSDAAILDAYVERNKNIPIRVLCLLNRASDYRDSYYHWEVYTNKKDGIRIDFNKEKLLKALGNKVLAEEVQYPSNKELEKVCKSTALPFIKRASYDSDKEFRLIFSGNKDTMKRGQLFEFKVKKDFFKECVDGIRFGHFMSDKKFTEVKNILKGYGIEKNVYRSKILRYEQWEKMVLRFVDSKHSNRRNKK
ncbi:MAG: hypothetical protein LBC64_00720 [Fibromonadaceae bacterium]|jgi:hypothetical protein|nr:hypothetical protein [Fibromonadaceae bacterium]